MRWVAVALLAAGCTGSQPAGDDAPDAGADADAPACDAVDVMDCFYPGRGHAIASVEGYTVHDDATGRDLPILVRYPDDAPGPFPVVIWSHGGDLDDNGHRHYAPWGTALATHGYVVIHVAHVIPEAAETAQLCLLGGVPADECAGNSDARYVLARSYDAVAVLDDLPAIATWLAGEGGPAIDVDAVSVSGHSGGSVASLTMAGAVRTLSPSVPRWSMPDARSPVTVALSPQGPGFLGYFDDGDETSMDPVTQPVLVITGDNDRSHLTPELAPAVRRETYENLPGGAGHQRLLYSRLPEGHGDHGTYGLDDRDADDEDLLRLTGAILSSVRAFLDHHLLGSEEARAWLESDAALRLAGADEAEWLVK